MLGAISWHRYPGMAMHEGDECVSTMEKRVCATHDKGEAFQCLTSSLLILVLPPSPSLPPPSSFFPSSLAPSLLPSSLLLLLLLLLLVQVLRRVHPKTFPSRTYSAASRNQQSGDKLFRVTRWHATCKFGCSNPTMVEAAYLSACAAGGGRLSGL